MQKHVVLKLMLCACDVTKGLLPGACHSNLNYGGVKTGRDINGLFENVTHERDTTSVLAVPFVMSQRDNSQNCFFKAHTFLKWSRQEKQRMDFSHFSGVQKNRKD